MHVQIAWQLPIAKLELQIACENKKNQQNYLLESLQIIGDLRKVRLLEVQYVINGVEKKGIYNFFLFNMV